MYHLPIPGDASQNSNLKEITHFLPQTALVVGYFMPLFITYTVEIKNRTAFLSLHHRELVSVCSPNTRPFILAFLNVVLLLINIAC